MQPDPEPEPEDQVQRYDLYMSRDDKQQKLRVLRFENPDAEAPVKFSQWPGEYVTLRHKETLGGAEVVDDHRKPIVIEDSGGKYSLTGTMEGGLMQNSSYFVLVIEAGEFRALTIDEWYSMRPTIRHRTLTTDEAEEEMREMRKKKATVRERWLMEKFKIPDEESVENVKEMEDSSGIAKKGSSSIKVKSEPEDIAFGDDMEGLFEGAGDGDVEAAQQGKDKDVKKEKERPTSPAAPRVTALIKLDKSADVIEELSEAGTSSEDDDTAFDPDDDFDVDLLFGGRDVPGSGAGMQLPSRPPPQGFSSGVGVGRGRGRGARGKGRGKKRAKLE